MMPVSVSLLTLVFSVGMTCLLGCGTQPTAGTLSPAKITQTDRPASVIVETAAATDSTVPVPRENWPSELHELLVKLRSQNQEPQLLQVVYADPEVKSPDSADGIYWRMSANQDVIDAHVKHFGLEPAKPGTKLTTELLKRYPKSWPELNDERVAWYAWPYNRDDPGIRAHFWMIMACDQQRQELVFRYWIWDVGI